MTTPHALKRPLPALSAAAVLAAAVALPTLATGEPPPRELARGTNVEDTTRLVSRNVDGDLPNGPSLNPSISQDERVNRVLAFESDATDLVAGDDNGVRDIFLVERAAGYGNNGSDWFPGRTELVSRPTGEGAANGPSRNPSVDGAPGPGGRARAAPTCVAFISDATNLVPGDTNGKADAFVRDFRKRRTVRISVDSRGKQANGDSFEVSVNGDCTRVAFTSSATNLALTKARKPGQKVAVTSRPSGGRRQVYVRILNRPSGRERDLTGVTFLASASSKKKAGNGDSAEPAFANQAGKALAFTSTSTNLDRGDKNSRSDVYERLMPNFPSGGRSLDNRFFTRLVSVDQRGQVGNGPSSAPTINGNGNVVAYQTEASNIIPGDGNGFSDIVRADFGKSNKPKIDYASSSAGGIGPGDGPSAKPSLTDAGTFVVFESDSDNFVGPRAADQDEDTNGVGDIFLWTQNRKIVFLESQGSEGQQLSFESKDPIQTARGNYIFFQTRDPFADSKFVEEKHPEFNAVPDVVNALAATQPAFQQIYMRYVGPK